MVERERIQEMPGIMLIRSRRRLDRGRGVATIGWREREREREYIQMA
jgi:hypothetical protein